LEFHGGNTSGMHMRAIARELDEQINSIKRELDNLTDLGILKFREELKKKIFTLNENFYLFDEFRDMFLKSYDPLERVKLYFKGKTTLEFILINEDLRYKLFDNGKSILDIFLIGEVNKDEFNDFLWDTFYKRKVKYAIISVEDFQNRMNYGDKLIFNILSQKGNIFLRDTLKIQERFVK
jgi:hypothetical protein